MRALLLLIATLCGASAFATGEIMDAFKAHYKFEDSSVIGQKSCGVCHVSDSDFAYNLFGAEMKVLSEKSGSSELTEAYFASLDKLDSDQDGTPNGDEIRADTLPGDPKSGGVVEAPPAPAATTKKSKSFPPKTGYHPAVVHFPIALFVGGLLLDLLGARRRDRTMLHAGWYCVVMAAVSSLGAIATGMWAMSLQKLPYRGLLFEHMAYAVAATVLMWAMVGIRVHRHERISPGLRALYIALALTCLAAITYAGHLGGVFVYGE